MTLNQKETLFINFMKENHVWAEWCREVTLTMGEVEIALVQLMVDPKGILDNMKMFDYSKRPNRGFWNNLSFRWKEQLDERTRKSNASH